jgi:hypothetical protein
MERAATETGGRSNIAVHQTPIKSERAQSLSRPNSPNAIALGAASFIRWSMLPTNKTRLPLLFRVAAWVSLAAVALATLSPLDARPSSGFVPDMERLVAFLTVGLLFGLGYPKHWIAVLGLLLAGIIGLEVLQLLLPDRHGQIADAAFKSAGCSLGFMAGVAVRRVSPW